MTTVEERAAQVLRLAIEVKTRMDEQGFGFQPQLDIELASGQRGTLLIKSNEQIEGVLLLIGTEERVNLVAHVADAFVRAIPIGAPIPEPGSLGDEFGLNPEVYELIAVTAMDRDGNIALVQSRYTRRDDGTLAFDEAEEMNSLGGGVIDALRSGLGVSA